MAERSEKREFDFWREALLRAFSFAIGIKFNLYFCQFSKKVFVIFWPVSSRTESDLTDPDPDDIFASAVLAANFSDEENDDPSETESDCQVELDQSFVESGKAQIRKRGRRKFDLRRCKILMIKQKRALLKISKQKIADFHKTKREISALIRKK